MAAPEHRLGSQLWLPASREKVGSQYLNLSFLKSMHTTERNQVASKVGQSSCTRSGMLCSQLSRVACPLGAATCRAWSRMATTAVCWLFTR